MGLALMTLSSTANAQWTGEGDTPQTTTGSTSSAGKIAPQPCDPRYWETMSARAWMEAEREIMQNQNLIFKPDSVLEYTCFDLMVGHASKFLGDVFVHTGYFGRIIIPRGTQPHAQEVALKSVVFDAMKPYLTDNFNNEFLSARAKDLRKPPSELNRAPSIQAPTAAGPAYTQCKVMAEVWKASKCMNFIDRKNYSTDENPDSEPFVKSDSFKPFITLKPVGGGKEVAGYDKAQFADPRKWPEECSNMSAQEWIDKDKVSANFNDQKYPFRQPLKKDYEDVRKMVEPGQCGNSTPIETGVTIILSSQSGAGKQDKVCTNPGCTLVGDKCQ